MSISNVRLENFKRFSNDQFNLGPPLTLLVGPNNSGKSSIIKALLALKQTVASTNEHEALAAQGDYVDLGTFDDFVHEHDRKRAVTIGLTFEESPGQTKTTTLFAPFIEEAESVDVDFVFDVDRVTDQARFYEIQIYIGAANTKFHLSLKRKKTRSTYWLFANEDLVTHVASLYPEMKSSKSKGKLKIRQEVIDEWQSGISVKYRGRLDFVLANRSEIFDHLVFRLFDQALGLASRELDRRLLYLGPLRSSPSRSYTRSSHSQEVGPTGEHTPSVFSILERRSRHSTTGERQLYKDFRLLNESVDRLFPGRGVQSENLHELVKIYVGDKEDKKSQKHAWTGPDAIPDVGFGFSQIFPVLVQNAVMSPGSLLIIEQPELHLHPKAQTEFAKILAQGVEQGKRYIVETHSEHLIRGLQVAISEKTVQKRKSGLSEEALNITYIPMAPDRPFRIPVNKWGELDKEWPEGFFDEAYRLSFMLIKNKARAQD